MNKSLEEHFNNWIEHLQKVRDLSQNTLISYKHDVTKFVEFIFIHNDKELTINDLNNLTISDFRSFLTNLRNQNLSNVSIARVISSLKSFFNYLIQSEIIENSAIQSLKSPKQKKSIPRPISAELAIEAIKYAEEIENEKWVGLRNKSILMLLYGCGLRISEALNLNFKDIKTEDYLLIKGKGGKERMVPLMDNIKSEIYKYINDCPKNFTNDDPLFVGKRMDRLSPRIVQYLSLIHI